MQRTRWWSAESKGSPGLGRRRAHADENEPHRRGNELDKEEEPEEVLEGRILAVML
jgi:hypothetical protein